MELPRDHQVMSIGGNFLRPVTWPNLVFVVNDVVPQYEEKYFSLTLVPLTGLEPV